VYVCLDERGVEDLALGSVDHHQLPHLRGAASQTVMTLRRRRRRRRRRRKGGTNMGSAMKLDDSNHNMHVRIIHSNNIHNNPLM